jgi:hypothetical protein
MKKLGMSKKLIDKFNGYFKLKGNVAKQKIET